MRRLSLWRTQPSDPVPLDVEKVFLLTAAGRERVPGDRSEGDCLAILPLDGELPVGAGEGSHGVALVPRALDGRVALNGAALAAGLYLLRDRDRVEVGGRRFQIAFRAVAEEVEYDPERHGVDLFCARTRRRIRVGETVVACPGTAAVRCELIFAATAWRAGVRCQGCGFDPAAKPWRPVEAVGTTSLRQLLDRSRGRRRG